MPAIQVEISVAANSANPNLFSGSAFEYSRGRNLLSLGVTAAATGTFITINSGADVVLEESPTRCTTTTSWKPSIGSVSLSATRPAVPSSIALSLCCRRSDARLYQQPT